MRFWLRTPDWDRVARESRKQPPSGPPKRRWKWPLVGVAAFLFMFLGTAYFAVAGVITTLSLDPGDRVTVGAPPASYDVRKQRFPSADGRINLTAWLISTRQETDKDRAIVLLHGLGDHGWNSTNRELTRAYVNAGFTVLAMDLRGHGESGGQWLGLGWHDRGDVRAAVDLLLAQGFAPGRIGIHGTSYGAATALLAAAAIPEIGAVVADSAFADMRDVMDAEITDRTGLPAPIARLLRPGIAWTARLVFDLNFGEIPPLLAVDDIAPRPIFFIHGTADTRIPVTHSQALFDADLNPANELWLLPGMGHTEGVWMEEGDDVPSPFQAEFLARVTEFFEQNLP